MYYVTIKHEPPEWIKDKPNLAHCSFCGAVYSKDTKWQKGFRAYEGTTNQVNWIGLRDIKEGVCPNCER